MKLVLTDKGARWEKDLNTPKSALTVSQRVAICFAAGEIGPWRWSFSVSAVSVGVSAALGVKAPVSLKSPDIDKPLFWGGLWGIPFGLLIKRRLEAAVPLRSAVLPRSGAGAVLIFLPSNGAGYFGLQQGGPMLAVYLLLVNLPFGIIAALAARAIIGPKP